MNVLIIHHLQPMWSDGLKKNHGLTSEQVMRRMAKFLRKTDYDKVILTQFDHWKPDYEHIETGLADLVDEWVEYGYGWDKNDFEQHPEIFAKGNIHSEYVLIAEWMRNLKGHSVTICGAFDSECIDDLQTALEHLEIEYQRLEEFIYGHDIP